MRSILGMILFVLSFCALANFEPITANNLNFDYRDQVGVVNGDLLIAYDFKFEPLKAELLVNDSDVVLAVDDGPIFDLPMLSGVFQKASSAHVKQLHALSAEQEMSTSFKEAELSSFEGDVTTIKNFQFKCAGDTGGEDISEAIKYYNACVNNGKSVLTIKDVRLPKDKQNLMLRELANAPRPSRIKSLRLELGSRKFKLTARVVIGILSPKLTSYGDISYSKEEDLVTIKLEHARAAGMDLREDVYDLFRDRNDPRITVEPPFIYISTKSDNEGEK